MPDTLYDDDILTWSEQQAALLRGAAFGERVNGLDWPNLIEEIDSVGRSELHACESLLAEALRRLLKVAAWPDSRAAGHLLAEAAALLPQARRRFAPSMRQHIDIQGLYDDVLPSVRIDEVDGRAAGPLAEVCRFSLHELLAARPDLPALARRLGAARPKSLSRI